MNMESRSYGESILFKRKQFEIRADHFDDIGEPLEKISGEILQIEQKYRTEEDSQFFNSLSEFSENGEITIRLNDPRLENIHAIGSGTTETLVFETKEGAFAYVIKPEFTAHLLDTEPRDTIMREKASYIIDRMLGVKLKPPVELGNIETMDGKKFKCSIQRFEKGQTFLELPHITRKEMLEKRSSDIEKCAILDLIINNRDGNPNNLIFTEEHIIPIDHANTFLGPEPLISFSTSLMATNKLNSYPPPNEIGNFTYSQPEIALALEDSKIVKDIFDVSSLLVSKKDAEAIQERTQLLNTTKNIRETLITIKKQEANYEVNH